MSQMSSFGGTGSILSGSIRSHQSVASEWWVRQRNAEIAAEVRRHKDAGSALQLHKRNVFMERQQSRIRSFRVQELQAMHAVEHVKTSKREIGNHMR